MSSKLPTIHAEEVLCSPRRKKTWRVIGSPYYSHDPCQMELPSGSVFTVKPDTVIVIPNSISKHSLEKKEAVMRLNPAFTPRGTVDWEPTVDGLSGTLWTRWREEWVGIVVFYDRDNDQVDFSDDFRFGSAYDRERLRRRLLEELDQHVPFALRRPEDAS
jgi:hypothetical protein